MVSEEISIEQEIQDLLCLWEGICDRFQVEEDANSESPSKELINEDSEESET